MKPLLLIIDDDPRVLEALGAELRPRFEAEYAIETYARPQDVLADLPRLREAHQEIALAIVDQKMPGITGLELVQRLHDAGSPGGATPEAAGTGVFEPTRSTRMMIITGYGGPEMAAKALGTRGVDLFREKPWISGALQHDVAGLLALYRAAAAEAGSLEAQALSTPDADAILAAALSAVTEGVAVELPDPDTLLACAYGQATDAQIAELQRVMLASPAARRVITDLFADLAELRADRPHGSGR